MMMRALRFLLLATSLTIGQLALAEHGIEHATHGHEEACVECLALPGFAALPVAPSPPPRVEGAPPAAERAVPPAPTFPAPLSYLSRAPPVSPSR